MKTLWLNRKGRSRKSQGFWASPIRRPWQITMSARSGMGPGCQPNRLGCHQFRISGTGVKVCRHRISMFSKGLQANCCRKTATTTSETHQTMRPQTEFDDVWNGGIIRVDVDCRLSNRSVLVTVTQLHLAQPGLIRFFKCLARVEPSQHQLNIPGRHRAQSKDGIHFPTQFTVNAVGLSIKV